MKPEDRILELVKEKPMLMSELQKESAFSTEGMVGIMAFLEKYKLVETMESHKHELIAKITPGGRQLLNLPDLPEDESPSNQLEVLERHWSNEMNKALDREADLNLGQKTINLYPLYQHTETANWIGEMAIRYKVNSNDVICAMWAIAKGIVGAKLERDANGEHSFFAITPPLMPAKSREREFSESIKNLIKARGGERQREIAGATR